MALIHTALFTCQCCTGYEVDDFSASDSDESMSADEDCSDSCSDKKSSSPPHAPTQAGCRTPSPRATSSWAAGIFGKVADFARSFFSPSKVAAHATGSFSKLRAASVLCMHTHIPSNFSRPAPILIVCENWTDPLTTVASSAGYTVPDADMDGALGDVGTHSSLHISCYH
jgi:hypothetical protein